MDAVEPKLDPSGADSPIRKPHDFVVVVDPRPLVFTMQPDEEYDKERYFLGANVATHPEAFKSVDLPEEPTTRMARRQARDAARRATAIEEARRMELARLIAARAMRRRRQVLVVVYVLDFLYHLTVLIVRAVMIGLRAGLIKPRQNYSKLLKKTKYHSKILAIFMYCASTFNDSDILSRIIVDAAAVFAIYARLEFLLKLYIFVDAIRTAMSSIYGFAWILIVRYAEILMCIQMAAALAFLRRPVSVAITLGRNGQPARIPGETAEDRERRDRIEREVEALSRPMIKINWAPIANRFDEALGRMERRMLVVRPNAAPAQQGGRNQGGQGSRARDRERDRHRSGRRTDRAVNPDRLEPGEIRDGINIEMAPIQVVEVQAAPATPERRGRPTSSDRTASVTVRSPGHVAVNLSAGIPSNTGPHPQPHQQMFSQNAAGAARVAAGQPQAGPVRLAPGNLLAGSGHGAGGAGGGAGQQGTSSVYLPAELRNRSEESEAWNDYSSSVAATVGAREASRVPSFRSGVGAGGGGAAHAAAEGAASPPRPNTGVGQPVPGAGIGSPGTSSLTPSGPGAVGGRHSQRQLL